MVVRAGVEADVQGLLQVEKSAATLLLEHGGHDLLAMHALAADDLRRGIEAGLLRVAEVQGSAVGFALAGELDAHAHLFEMDVDPRYGRRGTGSALLESVCAAAASRGYRCMTLVTLREVPWNAPFYARRGFVALAEGRWGSGLSALIERERMMGIPPNSRVVMQRLLPFFPREKGSSY